MAGTKPARRPVSFECSGNVQLLLLRRLWVSVVRTGLIAGVNYVPGIIQRNKVGFRFTITLTQDVGLDRYRRA